MMNSKNRQWWQREIVYQIYPKSFYDTNGDGIGDIPGIIQKLDYLRALGVTMLWISPIFKSPMADNGYDISDYLDLAPEFGSMADLEELIGKAKAVGIKIILDLVINHTSDEHVWFQQALEDPASKYHDYYIFKEGIQPINNWRSIFGGSVWEKVPTRDEYYYHTFAVKQPDLNWENPELRSALYDMVNCWLAKGIAGFRIDAITFIKKDLTFADQPADGADGLAKCTKVSRNQPGIGNFLHELKRKTFDRAGCVTVAEAPGVLYDQLDEFIGDDGYFSMIFDFKPADLDIASGSEWFRRIDWSVKDLRNRIMTSQTAIQKSGWGANFIENHDQPRSTTKYLREQAQNPSAIKMLAAMYFFLRGTPFLYQGQELGMTNFERKTLDAFNDISSLDQYHRSLLEGFNAQEAMHFVNLRSRDNARTPFPWSDAVYGGFSSSAPWLAMNENYTSINAARQEDDPKSILNFYRAMIHFRQNSPHTDCLIYGEISPVETADDELIAYLREEGNKRILCVFNFSGRQTTEPLPAPVREVIFNSLPGEANVKTANGQLCLAPYQAVLLWLETDDCSLTMD